MSISKSLNALYCFDERAQDNAYFIDIEEKYSRLSERKNKKRLYRCTLKVTKHLALAESQSVNSS
jgi:hypothetical protein